MEAISAMGFGTQVYAFSKYFILTFKAVRRESGAQILGDGLQGMQP